MGNKTFLKNARSPESKDGGASFARRKFIRGALFAGTGVLAEGSIAALSTACGHRERYPGEDYYIPRTDAGSGADSGHVPGMDADVDSGPDSGSPVGGAIRDMGWDSSWNCRLSDSFITTQVHLRSSIVAGGVRITAADMEFDQVQEIYAAILDLHCSDSGLPMIRGLRIELYDTETFDTGGGMISITCNGLTSSLSMNLTVVTEGPPNGPARQ